VDESLNLGDISKIDLDELKKLGEIDLITHGSPCQDFSIAGRLAGGDKGSGTRSSLMWCTVDIVEAVRPKYVVWENVKNLLSVKNKHNFDGYIQVMDELGYKSYYQVLNAKDYGIPQNRERVFTVSIRKDLGIEYEFPKRFELKLKLKDVLEETVDEKYYLSDKTMSDFITDTKNDIKMIGNLDIKGHDCVKRVYGVDGISPTLTDMQGGNRQPKILEDFYKNRNVREYENIAPTLRSERVGLKVIEPTIKINNATKKGYDEAINGDSINLQYPDSSTRRGRVGHSVSQTLMANDSMGVVDKLRIRKLIPLECWRLMGFDDEDFYKAQAVPTSNTQLYKQARKQYCCKCIRSSIQKFI